MKKTLLIASILIASSAFLAYEVLNDSFHKSTSGANAGYCGDPASGNRNCTSCHSGAAEVFVADLITSNVPVEGYVPNSSYTITATISGAGHSKFGFQVSPQDPSGTFLGTLINTSSETKLTGTGSNYITHTSAGVSGTDSRTWTFDWTAPDQGTGDVIMYSAFNVTNSNGSSSGDTIYTSTYLIPENTTVGIAKKLSDEQSISVFPNPATELISIKVSEDIFGSTYIITDQAGRQVLTGKLLNQRTTLNISQFETGIYFLQIGERGEESFKILKK